MASLVSTVVPVYNRAGMVREAVASILAQTYRPIEIVIVDDGSTDGTAAVVDALSKEHRECVRVVHVPNGGPGAAREAGRQLARGEYIQYLDADDLLEPNKFELQVAGLTQNPGADVAYGWTRLRVASGELLPHPWKRTGERVETMFPAFLQSRWWDTSTPLYRRSVVERAGRWLATRVEEDWEYDARIASFGTRLHFTDTWVSETRQLDPERLSTARGAAVLRDRATAHALIYSHARAAGLDETYPEMRSFSRELFLLARQCGAAGLRDQSKGLFDLARAAAVDPDTLDFQGYAALAGILGWFVAGKLACTTDLLRWQKSRS